MDPSGRGGRVQRRPGPGQHPQPDVAGRQIVDGVDQVPEAPAETVQLPDYERVTGP